MNNSDLINRIKTIQKNKRELERIDDDIHDLTKAKNDLDTNTNEVIAKVIDIMKTAEKDALVIQIDDDLLAVEITAQNTLVMNRLDVIKSK